MAKPQAPKGYIPVNVDGDVEVYIYQPTDPRIKAPSWYIYYYYNQKIYRNSLKTKNQKAAHQRARETAEKLNAGQGTLLHQVRANLIRSSRLRPHPSSLKPTRDFMKKSSSAYSPTAHPTLA